jgi:hypothetical protein
MRQPDAVFCRDNVTIAGLSVTGLPFFAAVSGGNFDSEDRGNLSI